jgi:hypothetical protein
MECWNSAFNAQGLRVIFVIVQVGALKIYVVAVGALREKGKIGWNSVYHKKWWKTSLGPSYFTLLKFSFSVTRLMPYYAETDHSRPLIVGLYG